jgi:hypothetical protein
MVPPPLPFIAAPGEYTLYHEWGHHVDRTWSGESEEISFSLRWFSRFYELYVRPSRLTRADHGFQWEYDEARPIESNAHAAEAVVVWWHASSELFADLFEDWMRGEKKLPWDQCEPKSLNTSEACGHPSLKIALLPGVQAEDVRAGTYPLFTAGIRPPAELPPVRPGMFGPNTDEMLGHLREVMVRARAGRW